jgi:NodT family efflux transporter outer membrane factor (OMF) lipoprotein
MSTSPTPPPAKTIPAGGDQARAWEARAWSRPILGVLVAAGLASACTVGPDFKRPGSPEVAGYTPQPITATVATPGVAGGEAQRLVSGADIPADWWTLFHSRPLNDLIEQALANNHDLKAAQAALAVAHEGVLAQKGAYFPTVTGGFSATRQRTSAALAPTPSSNATTYSLITPQVSVAYVPDVFGLNRRTVEAAKAQEDAARYQLAAAHLTLTSNVAAAAIEEASLETQIDATRELIALDAKAVEILKYQLSKGYASRLDLAAQEAQLAQVTATLPALVKQSAHQRDLLAVLTGRFPSQAPAERFDLAGLTLPQDLPLSLPSALVAQRPDVLQAEANMHAASAEIGIARANRLPNITLTGDVGTMGLSFSKVFGAGAGFWDLGAAATAPLFDGGALKHRERAARAAYVQASEQYRSTVLTAFQNVADTLAALDQDAEALKASAAAADATKVSLDLSQRQYKDGYASYLSVLTAGQADQQARISLVQAQANRFADTAALFQALGGGWWSRAELTRNSDAH